MIEIIYFDDFLNGIFDGVLLFCILGTKFEYLFVRIGVKEHEARFHHRSYVVN
jgi:hypothetical protein